MHNHELLIESLEHVMVQVEGALYRAAEEKPNRFFSPWKYRTWKEVVTATQEWVENVPAVVKGYREAEKCGTLTDKQKEEICMEIITYIHNSYEIFEDLFYLVYKDDYTVMTMLDNTYMGWSISKT